ncbi:MAG: NifB/NifX family molybdenum-iron cluster-binding protein [Thermoplasmata archaeon]|nr:NifB/NifX family molybdenum-iron cluster-binding protein [Thermoplasmata archaeon]
MGEHFGRVPTYTIVDTETGEVRVIANTSEHMGGQGYPPHIIAEAGADALVCSNLGRRAIAMFSELGLEVYVGATGTVRDAVDRYTSGRLQHATENTACAQHAFGKGHGHNHHQ